MKITTNIKDLDLYKKKLIIERRLEDFLCNAGYLKIDLPVLSPSLIPESYLEIFETEFNYFDKKAKLYLIPSPELFLKRLLFMGMGHCYFFGKSFRNSEPNSKYHSIEFTMLEYYRVNADYMDIAEELLNLLRYINGGHNSFIYQGIKISLAKWEMLTVAEAFLKYAGIPASILLNKNKFLKKSEEKGYDIKGFTYQDVFSQIYTQEVEPHLGMNGCPTVIYDYPKEFAALAKLNKDKKTAQRFEFYIAGIELGDCYSELIEEKELIERFKIEDQKRKEQDRIIHPVDNGLLHAIKYKSFETCSGIAIGFDRLAMIFTNAASIQQLKLINVE